MARKPRRGNLKRQYEILGGASALAGAALVISIFVLTGLNSILIQTNQYASVIAAVLVDLANGDREAKQLNGLTVNPLLVAAAQAKANDMAQKSYFAHISPEGKDSWYWFKQAGYKFEYAGENLAVDFSDSSAVESAWMNSPSHRDNLLNGHYTEIGIATAAGFYQGHPTIFVAQMFGSPAKVAAQQPLKATSPKDPTKPALASAVKEQPNVLGEAIAKDTTAAVTTKAPTNVVEKTAPRYASLLDRIAVSPRATLGWVYYIVGMLVLVALFYTTELEFKRHHMHKFALAGVMFVILSGVFWGADRFMFGSPTVAENTAVSTAAVGAILQ